jgi:hypothetical protein
VDQDESSAPEPSRLLFFLRLVAVEIAKYRMGDMCSGKDIRTIEALWREGLPLREHARREGVTPQAIVSRIERLRERAPLFWNWWRLKNRMRCRR